MKMESRYGNIKQLLVKIFLIMVISGFGGYGYDKFILIYNESLVGLGYGFSSVIAFILTYEFFKIKT